MKYVFRFAYALVGDALVGVVRMAIVGGFAWLFLFLYTRYDTFWDYVLDRPRIVCDEAE
jgi:hypothetical protein